MSQGSALFRTLRQKLPSVALRAEEPLSARTSFRIGGPAEVMAFPLNAEQLKAVLLAARELGVCPLILGAGTNVLAPDEGIRGLVIYTRDALREMRLLTPTRIEAMAGAPMARLALFAKDAGLTGLEFAHGIPGTIGGGIYMNAGAYGGELRNVAVKTEVLHFDGTSEVLEGEAQKFSYRSSAFQKMDGVILRTELELQSEDREQIAARMRELSEKRRASQPLELPSAGSAFKRPQGGYAAALIEQAGLKGFAVGGAAVSEKHAGFIVNYGGATAKDVLELIHAVQEQVYESSGVRLEPEIRLLGAKL